MPHEPVRKATVPSAASLAGRPVPEDVRAEQDAEERRTAPQPLTTSAGDTLPEDVQAERFAEALAAEEEHRLRRQEGSQPADEEA